MYEYDNSLYPGLNNVYNISQPAKWTFHYMEIEHKYHKIQNHIYLIILEKYYKYNIYT